MSFLKIINFLGIISEACADSLKVCLTFVNLRVLQKDKQEKKLFFRFEYLLVVIKRFNISNS